MWRHAASFHQTDPQFHRDISYFVSVLPFHQTVVGYLTSIVVTCLVVTLVAAYLYGALRIRGRGRKMTPAVKAQVSVLLGLYLLLKAASYWLNRYALTTSSRGPVTGLSYTDSHAVLPGLTILTVVAVLVAVLLFANVAAGAAALDRGRPRRDGGGVAALRQRPGRRWSTASASSRAPRRVDRASIERNQAATLQAFGLDQGHHDAGVRRQRRRARPPRRWRRPGAPRRSGCSTRTSCPRRSTSSSRSRPTTSSSRPLDIDHYPLGARDQDVAIAVRELNLSGISRSSWSNNHLIYTHGYGVVAAPTDQLDPRTAPRSSSTVGCRRRTRSRSTGRRSTSARTPRRTRSWASRRAAPSNVEFDHPSTNGGSNGVHNTYHGDGGVPIGSRLTRLLYAVKLRDPNIFFSSEINNGSQLLTVRNPRPARRQGRAVADPRRRRLPGRRRRHVQWVVDGYTSTANYPDSQRINLHSATTNSLTNATGSTVASRTRRSTTCTTRSRPSSTPTPARSRSTPGTSRTSPTRCCRPGRTPSPVWSSRSRASRRRCCRTCATRRTCSTCSAACSPSYHVTDPSDFYNGNDFWKVPNDPTVAATNVVNGGRHRTRSSPTTAVDVHVDVADR